MVKNSTVKMKSNFILGPPPWKEDYLKKVYFQDFVQTRRGIQQHPGFTAHQALQSLRLSLDIFTDAVLDLMHSIDIFSKESQSKEFWMRPNRKQFDKFELAIRKGVFFAATSTMALVEISRRISRRYIVTDYQTWIDENFANNEEHKFIQDLRDFVSHFQIIEPEWRVSWSREGRRVQFLLKPEKLLVWNKWKPLAKNFIKKYPDGIDIKILFENYKRRVEKFNQWFQIEIEKVTEPDLSEYRKYENLLKRFGSRSFWEMMFQQVINRKNMDPYKYLNQYLTKPEIEEVFSLPMHSKVQVDRIIEIIDEYNACDYGLKNIIYKAFKVKIS